MKRVFIRGLAEHFPTSGDALKACGVEPVFSLDLSVAETCDGLLLPGGADVDPARYGQPNTASNGINAARDEDEINLILRFMEMEKPILGICRGHQVLNVALGGSLIQHVPDHAQIDNKDIVHPVTAEHPFLQSLYGDRFISNSAHHQVVDRLGEGLSVTCRSEEGYIEGVIHENGRVIGVQFHPERMAFAHLRPDAVDGAPLFRSFCAML